jgi:hypothetical protein
LRNTPAAADLDHGNLSVGDLALKRATRDRQVFGGGLNG